MSVVYWLFDDACSLPQVEGYIGVSSDLPQRIRTHRRKRFRNGFSFAVLFEGPDEECYTLEKELRPRAGIGWNMAAGGPDGYKRGITGIDRKDAVN